VGVNNFDNPKEKRRILTPAKSSKAQGDFGTKRWLPLHEAVSRMSLDKEAKLETIGERDYRHFWGKLQSLD